MHVDFKDSGDPRVSRNQGPLADVARRLRITIEEVPAVLARHPQPRLFAPGMLSAISARTINASDADIINAHWTNFGYLSIGQIARITKPFVWSLHDMWAFTGGLNYAPDDAGARWRTGYSKDNRAPQERGWDVERWVAARKKRSWSQPRHLISPSRWLADLAAQSDLLSKWHVHVIANPIDTSIFRPYEKDEARAFHNLPRDVPLILFALSTDLDDPRKGWDLLRAALIAVHRNNPEVELAVMGHAKPPEPWETNVTRTHWLGRIKTDEQLALAYSAADVTVVPSRQDNLPQTATEAQTCGCPVVAFHVGGLPDIVIQRETGYLALPEDSFDLASGIEWVLEDAERRNVLGNRARARAVELWSPGVVGRAHQELFSEIIG